jgi:hypothetical protein
LAAAAAIAKLGAQATAALGTVKSKALQAFSKIFPLIEQLEWSGTYNPGYDLEKSLEKLPQESAAGNVVHDSKNTALKIISTGALCALFAIMGIKFLPLKKSLPTSRTEYGSVAVQSVEGK